MESSTTDAILLIGPTGSGKSPLGDALQADGLTISSSRKTRSAAVFYHFDFGENLRRAERGDFSDKSLITAADRAFLTTVLEQGAVLERERFYLAGNILQSFLAEKKKKTEKRDNCVVVLNGFPRHSLQAEYLREQCKVCVRLLVVLESDTATIKHRLENNTGGDRTNRQDDASTELLQKKLQIFRERTLPLIEWYEKAGVAVVRLQSDKDTTAQNMVQQLQESINKMGDDLFS